jgi:hypothetical protein
MLITGAAQAATVHVETGTGFLPVDAETANAVPVVDLVIQGRLVDGRGGNAPNVVDLYGVTLDTGDYTFATSGRAGDITDPVLFLFDGAGNGVYFNDNAAGTQSGFWQFVSAGTYYVGIGFYGVDALDGNFDLIFDTFFANEGGPLPGAGALADWSDSFGQTLWDVEDYEILVTKVPEPATGALALLALVGVAAARRRRIAR